jgi:POT family proton-dependent oligopeptide transporter
MDSALPRTARGAVARPVVAADDQAFFGHPRGLLTLFFTEMWERFSYYGMRALLILFMTAPATSGGLAFDTPTAGAVYGLYTSMVYLASLPGGWIADRLIGQRRAVLWGGVVIASGHFSMAFPSLITFYVGLVLIVIGTGLLKGNVSVLVGSLYATHDQRRDAGFSIYYMGINLGAFAAPLVCGYLGQRVSWHAGFAAAGVGMVLGVVQYAMGGAHLGTAGLAPAGSPRETATLRRRTTTWAGVAGGLVVLAVILAATGVMPVSPTMVADAAGYLLLVTTVIFFGWLFFAGQWTPAERGRLYVIGIFFLAAALFWSSFEQAGSTLNLFAARDTRTVLFGWDFPSSWFQSVNAVFIIAFAPVFAWLWLRLGPREPSSPVKFSIGLMLVGAGFIVMALAAQAAANGVKVSPNWLMVTYLLHTFGELCLSPVGLSSMTKLAPARVGGLMMGVWFLGASVGNFIGGRLASFYEAWPLTQLFGVVAAFGIASGLLLLACSPAMKRLIGDAR